jgi:hypothetical protein
MTDYSSIVHSYQTAWHNATLFKGPVAPDLIWLNRAEIGGELLMIFNYSVASSNIEEPHENRGTLRKWRENA